MTSGDELIQKQVQEEAQPIQNQSPDILDISGLQEAITIDPVKLEEFTQGMTGPELDTTDTAPKDERQAQDELYDASGTPSGSSIAGNVVDIIDRTFFDNALTPELERDAQADIDALSNSDYALMRDAYLNYAKNKEPIPKELAAKVPNFMRFMNIEKGNGVIQSYVKPMVQFPADMIQGAGMGIAKGAVNVPTVAVDVLNWIDDHTLGYIPALKGEGVIPNEAIEAIDTANQDLNKVFDSYVPDGLLPSLAVAVGENAVGMGFFGFVPGAGLKARLFRSALSSSFAFGLHGENIFNALNAYPKFQNDLFAYLASDPNDGTIEAVLKNALGSVVTDLTFEGVMKVFKTVRNVYWKMTGKGGLANMTPAERAEYKAVMKQVQDMADEYETAATKTASTASPTPTETTATSSKTKTTKKVSNTTTPPTITEGTGQAVPPNKTDVNAILDRANSLMKGEDLDQPFVPTHDVINTGSGPMKEFYEENGVERMLLNLGNDVPDGNVLGRDAKEYTTVTNKETIANAMDAAKDILGDGFTDLEIFAKATNKLSEAVVISRQMLVEHTGYLRGLLEKYNRPDFPAAVKAQLETELTNALSNTARVTYLFDTISTNTGRALQAHKISLTDTPLAEIFKASTEGTDYAKFMEKLAQMAPAEKIALARGMISAGTGRKSVQVLKQFAQSNWQKGMSVLSEAWFNSLLSGVKTGMRNHLGNFIKGELLMPLDDMARGIAFHDREAWINGVKSYWAMRQSLAEAWHMAKASFSLGQNILGLDTGMVESRLRAISSTRWGVDPDTVFGKFLDGLGAAVNFPTRYLMASDAFHSQLAYRRYVRTLLWGQAEDLISKGLKPAGMNKTDFILDYVAKNFDQYFVDVADSAGNVIKGGAANIAGGDIYKKAMEAAKHAVFAQDLPKGSYRADIQNFLNRHPATKVFVPFFKIPTNILYEGVGRSPLGFLRFASPEFKRALAQGGEAQRRAVSQLIVGSAFTALGVGLACSGHVTGAAPRNRSVRDSIYAKGWRPYSFKAGDTYISYEGVEPLSTVFGLIADFTQMYKDGSGDISFNTDASEESALYNTAASLLFAVTHNFTNKSYMTGLSNMLDVLTSDDPNAINRVLGEFASSTVPNILQSARQVIDPSMREIRGTLDRMMSKMPIFNESLPMKYNWITGEPEHYMGDRASGVSPIVYSSKVQDSSLEALGHAIGLFPSLPRKVNDITLTGQQYSDFARIHGTIKLGGKTMLQAMEQTIKHLGPDAPKDELRVKLTEVVHKYRKAAKKELIKMYSDLQKKKKKEQPAGISAFTGGAGDGTAQPQMGLNAIRNL